MGNVTRFTLVRIICGVCVCKQSWKAACFVFRGWEAFLGVYVCFVYVILQGVFSSYLEVSVCVCVCMGGVDCQAAVDLSVSLTLPACLFVCAFLFHCSPAWVFVSECSSDTRNVLFVNPSVSVNQLVVKTVE